MGAINGAMIIAPMMVGALSDRSPNVAIALERKSMKKKPNVGIDACRNCKSTSSCGTGFSMKGFQSAMSIRQTFIV